MRALRMVLVIVVLSSLVSGCQWLCQALCGNSQQPDPKAAVFSGQVVSSTGTPLPDATVTINGQSVTATDKGLFKLTVGSAPSYIVTIRHKGYGVFSRIYTKGVHRDRWPLYRATLTTLNPAVGGIVQDTQAANCLAARPHSGWDHLEVKGGPVSGNLRAALDSAYKPAGCNAGVSIAIPPNALVDADGNNPPPQVEVEVSTVDVFSPEAMPGDWGFRSQRGDGPQSPVRQGFMQTLGAGSISVTAGGKSYQLKRDQRARLTIPIDPTALRMFKRLEQQPPSRIPLLLYQEKTGTWELTGTGRLNESATGYIADLPHFSEWNMDVVFSNTACTQIDSRLIDGGYYLKAVPSVIPSGGLQPHEFDVPNNASCGGGDPFFCYIQSAWRLPSNPAHGAGQVSFMPGTRTGPTITYNRANFVVPFGAQAPNQTEMPPVYVSGAAGQPGSYPNCTTSVTFADKPVVVLGTTATTLTLTVSGYWGPSATIVPSHATDRYDVQWCNTSANPCTTDPNYPQNPNAGGWTTFTAVPTLSPTGPRPARSVTSSPIARNSLTAGTYQFRVRAHVGHSSFGAGGYDTPWSDVTTSVTIGGGNTAPSLAPIANQTVNVGDAVSIPTAVTDPDGGPFTYSLTASPAGASIDPTGLISWIPSAAQGATSPTVTVQVTDSGGLSDTESFTITVNPQIKIENRMGGAAATGCATPIDTSVIRLQVQGNDKLLPLSTDTADGSIPQYGVEGVHIGPGSDSMVFNTTGTSYTVIMEMGSWNIGGSGGFVQRRYTHSNATDGCTLARYRYMDFTVTGQGPGLLTLRIQPSGNQYQVSVQGGTATLSTAAAGQKTMTDFARTTPYSP